MSCWSIAELCPLVICRGPVRLEALEVFANHHITKMGMLLSRNDSFRAPQALAPELACRPKNCAVHYVPEYHGGATPHHYIEQILHICTEFGYNAVFPGYGFMAEAPELAQAVQQAGFYFIGPSASVGRLAGAKDAAKRTALSVGAQVVPGFNDALARAYVMQLTGQPINQCTVDQWRNSEGPDRTGVHHGELSNLLESVQVWLEQSLTSGQSFVAATCIVEATYDCLQQLWQAYPNFDLRLKAVQGGGGKGQRIVSPGISVENLTSLMNEIWSEVGVTGEYENKNCVIELNLPRIRHWEIQLVGNGQWCLDLGGRDCSVQRHEQKLIEMSLTSAVLESKDGETLKRLAADAVAFGQAVGLDSVSTYEAMVTLDEPQHHFFMEMNTRLQVEHRVTELVCALEFPRPDQAPLKVTSLIHLMCLLAVYGRDLPKPTRIPRANCSLEVRINSMNHILGPAAGALIQHWSEPLQFEFRDDQGLSRPNPDTGQSRFYRVIGAYDSNLALSLVHGESMHACFESMCQVLVHMKIYGQDVETNVSALLGMLAVLKNNASFRVATSWVRSYLELAASVQHAVNQQGLSQFNAHRVIYWSITGDLAGLWPAPGKPGQAQLAALSHVCAQYLPCVMAQGVLVLPEGERPAITVLDPPPDLDDVLRAPSGGVYYSQAAPGQAPFVQNGALVKKGATVAIIEVMKMFNPVLAPCDFIVEDMLVPSGTTIKKGQPLLRIQSA